MTGIVNWVKSCIPPQGTVDRTILYYWPLSTFIQQTTDRDRFGATYATLGLQGRLSAENNPFSTWMKTIGDPALVKEAENAPSRVLLTSQLHDLICKVIVSAGFYATSHISFYATLTHLLSHSQKVSKVAQPLLDRLASLPIPHPLQSARVIAFAPVALKLLHMAFLAIDPKGENSVMELFKRGSDKTGQALEFLWCLRFSLISLGISKNIYESIASTLFSQTLNYFVKDPQVKALINLPILLFKPNKGEEAQGYKYLLSLIGGMDSFWPTIGFQIGLLGMWSAFFASAAPCDFAALDNLYTRITTTEISPAKIDAVRQIRLSIKQAVQSRTITPSLAHELEELIIAKGVDACLAMQHLNDPHEDSAFVDTVKELCAPNHNALDANMFVEILFSFSKLEIKTARRALEVLSELIDPIKAEVLKGKALQSLKKFVLSRIESLDISLSSTSDFVLLLDSCKSLCGECTTDLQRVQLSVWDKLFQLVSSVDVSQLNSDEESQLDRDMNWLSKIASTPEQQEKAYFVSQQYHIARLNLNLKWYLENQPAETSKQKVCEDLICKLALRFYTNLESQLACYQSYQIRQPTSDFKQFVWESKAFDFARDTIPIPANFKFGSFDLPFVLGKLSRDVNATQDRWTFARNFPHPTCDQLTENSFPHDDTILLPRVNEFVSTETIRTAASD